MNSRKKHSKIYLAFAAAVAAAALTGCGGEAAHRSIDPPTTGGTTGGITGGITGGVTGGTTGGTTGGITGGTTGGTTGGFDPAASFTFEVTGANGLEPAYTTPSIYTDTKLRVRVNAGAAGRIRTTSGSYSNYSASYSCVSYRLRVQGRTFNTGYLTVPGAGVDCGTGGQTSQILDMSSFLTPGLGAFTIEVSAQYYSAYYEECLKNPVPYMYNCGRYWQYPVYQTHTVTGSIDVEVNGSSL